MRCPFTGWYGWRVVKWRSRLYASWDGAAGLFDAAVVDVDPNLVDPIFFEFWPFFFLPRCGGLDSLSSQFSHFHGFVAVLDGVFHELAHRDDGVDIVE